MMQKLGEPDFLQRMHHLADAVHATHPSVEVWRAKAYVILGLADLAEQALLRGLAEAPKHYRLRLWMARQYSQKKRFAEAVAINASIVRDYPSVASAWRNLGAMHLKNADPNAAIAALQSAARINPNDPKVWLLMSRGFNRLNRKVEAHEARERAASLVPLDSGSGPIRAPVRPPIDDLFGQPGID
jgi:predicted Zn-dependent protease